LMNTPKKYQEQSSQFWRIFLRPKLWRYLSHGNHFGEVRQIGSPVQPCAKWHDWVWKIKNK